MNAALRIQIAVSVFALHQQRRRFDPDFFAHLHVDGLGSKTAALDPPLIHPQQHVRPVARFRAPRAGVDGEERVRAIVFTGEKLAQLEFLELVQERRLFARQFLFRFRAMGRIGFFGGELAQRFEIGDGAFEFAERIQKRTDPRDFLDVDLGSLAVRPEIGGGHALLESA